MQTLRIADATDHLRSRDPHDGHPRANATDRPVGVCPANALQATPGNSNAFLIQIRATARTGTTPREVIQACQPVARCPGVSRANPASTLANPTHAELEAASE